MPLTLKPFLFLTSVNDDIMKGDQLVNRARTIGPVRTTVELASSSHDVFTSDEAAQTDEALAHLRSWLTVNGFVSVGGAPHRKPWSVPRPSSRVQFSSLRVTDASMRSWSPGSFRLPGSMKRLNAFL